MAADALRDVSLALDQTDLAGIVGPTGSGKSTLIQHLNGLLAPTSGRVLVDDAPIGAEISARRLHTAVGLVFQFPEHQLFEATVAEDVGFGPRNLGCDREEIRQRVDTALEMVGLDAEAFGARNPFELSGGEKRRVAIAGVLALRPRILVLDEPTAGLDPPGRRELMKNLRDLHYKQGIGIVIVSHAVDEIAEIVERLIVLKQGTVVFDGLPSVAFGRSELLAGAGLEPPQGAAIITALAERGCAVDSKALGIDEVAEAIAAALPRGKGGGRP